MENQNNLNNNLQENKKGFGTTSLICGIISFVLFWIPCLSFILAILSIIFGIIGLTKKNSKGIIITGLIFSSITILIYISIFISVIISIIKNPESLKTQNYENTISSEEIAKQKAEKKEAERKAKEEAEKEAKEEAEKNFKNSCETYTFKEIARNPDKYKGKKVKFTGKVIQVSEGILNSVDIRMDVTKNKYDFYEDTIYCTYSYKKGESKILEKDIITIYGTCEGDYTYTSILGANITLPRISVKYVTIQD